MSLPFLVSPHGAEPVVVEGTFRHSPGRVFAAWTTPADIVRWFGPGPVRLASADVDLRPGGQWRFAYDERDGRRDVLRGEYLVVEPERRLEFSWIHERRFADGRSETTQPSNVTVTFEPNDDGTFVRLVHSAIVREEGRLGVGEGWSGTFARMAEALDDAAARGGSSV